MPESDEVFLRANAEAGEVFERLRRITEDRARDGGTSGLSVLELTREAGLELSKSDLTELRIPEIVPIHRFIPWDVWFPWRPLWCWWWHRYQPWYHCCPYWWHRCHWYAE
ncbi:hypothetical protein [Sphaerisporangium aureirubrum]|uniref:Uncharacterized protein n=1 Tax=Sphaerisporangium aureirubrum TaxID=1544736 RepID=A0ABW1NG66_9ACTN